MTDVNSVTNQIVQDVLSGAPFESYSIEPPRTVAQAYAIQDELAYCLVETGRRDAVIGWKIAANSEQLMKRFNLVEPATGRVFADQRHLSPATLFATEFTEFAFEPEIAAIMRTTLDISQAPFLPAVVAQAIDRFIPAMELLDMRNTDMSSTHIPDAIAQNISNAGAVLGGPGVAPDQLRAEDVQTIVKIDGETRHDVVGAAPQSPLAAVTWLANHLASRGIALKGRQVVLCGTHSPIWYHKGTGNITVEMSGLGTVAVSLK